MEQRENGLLCATFVSGWRHTSQVSWPRARTHEREREREREAHTFSDVERHIPSVTWSVSRHATVLYCAAKYVLLSTVIICAWH